MQLKDSLARNMFIKRIVAYSPCNFTKSMEQQLSNFFTCLWDNLTVAHYFFSLENRKLEGETAGIAA
jgi:hypothetical protein